jgi:hypothetical protein
VKSGAKSLRRRPAKESAEELEDRRLRALERANWPSRLFKLGEEPEDDDPTLTPDQRVALVWGLTVDSWLAKHRSLPTFDRSSMPTRLVRRGKAPRTEAPPKPARRARKKR